MRQGFTLVEIAIVLVIIGLLIGGIMVGKDLVRAGSIRNFTAQIEKYNAAGAAFRGKFRLLAGDLRPEEATQYGFATRTGAIGQGDGNGILEGCAQSSQRLGCETALFWRDLLEAHMIPSGSAIATNAAVDGTLGGFDIDAYLPKSPMRSGGSVLVYARNSRNMFYISQITAVSNNGTVTTAAHLSPQEAKNLDDKMDDGAPDNGIVRPMTNLQTEDAGGAPSTTTCVNNTLTPVGYNAAEAYVFAITCQLSVRSSL